MSDTIILPKNEWSEGISDNYQERKSSKKNSQKIFNLNKRFYKSVGVNSGILR